jgi:hypothetical protein
MSLLKMTLEKPADLTTASKYTAFNGFVYCGLGLGLILWPGVIQTVFRERAFVGDEQGLFRVIGFAVLLIGYYLVIGGRSGSRQATAASVIDRWTIVPLVLLPIAISGVFPHFLLVIVIVDVCLATSTWMVLRRADTTRAPVQAAGHSA